MKRILLMLLALLLVIMPVMTACTNNGTEDKQDVQQDDKTEQTGDPTDRLSYAFSPNIPEGTRFDGKKFRSSLC